MKTPKLGIAPKAFKVYLNWDFIESFDDFDTAQRELMSCIERPKDTGWVEDEKGKVLLRATY